MDGKPTKKDMAFMGQDQSAKSMGNKFYFSMHSMFGINNSAPLVNKVDRKLPEYPLGDTVSNNELMELDQVLIRSKNSPSGASFKVVSSQGHGVESSMSHYHFLRTNKYFGLGSPTKTRSPFFPDLDIGRTKIMAIAHGYKLSRALELTYQLFVIQSSWSMHNQAVDFSIPIEKLVEELAKTSYATDDILNSRGWWTYMGADGKPKSDRPFLTLPDIICMINGTYKPKFFAVKS